MDHLMTYTYGQRPGDLLILMSLGVLLWGALAARLGSRRVWRLANGLLLLAAMAAILHATLFWSRDPGERKALLEPFQTLRLARLYPELYREMFMNILLFFPFGLGLAQLLPKRWRPGARAALTLGLGAAFSVFVEGAQYLWGLGIAETDDVLCNALGAGAGALSLTAEALFRGTREGKR